jgi:hypothetical protein
MEPVIARIVLTEKPVESFAESRTYESVNEWSDGDLAFRRDGISARKCGNRWRSWYVSPAVLDLLSRHKAGIVTLLRSADGRAASPRLVRARQRGAWRKHDGSRVLRCIGLSSVPPDWLTRRYGLRRGKRDHSAFSCAAPFPRASSTSCCRQRAIPAQLTGYFPRRCTWLRPA